MFKHYANEGNYTAKLPPKKTKEWRKDNPDQPDPFYDAKYTRQDGGQLEFGSFSDEGMQFYGQVANEIKTRRTEHGEEYLTFEAQFREMMRAKHAVSAEAGNEKGKKGRNSGAGGGHAAKKRKVIIFQDDDDEQI